VRILGEVRPHGVTRNGYPQTSEYERQKKNKKRKYQGRDWKKELAANNIGKNEIEKRRDEVSNEISQLTANIKEEKAELAELDIGRWEVARSYRKSKSKMDYPKLQNARQEERIIRKKLMPKEKNLRELRQTLYYWNKLYDVAPAENEGNMEIDITEEGKREEADEEKEEGAKADEDEEEGTVNEISWERFNNENFVEKLDISALLQTKSDTRHLVFSGTDYGIRKMSETVPQTLDEILVHIRRFQDLQNPQGKQSDLLCCILFYFIF
jgi:hypothetical protein